MGPPVAGESQKNHSKGTRKGGTANGRFFSPYSFLSLRARSILCSSTSPFSTQRLSRCHANARHHHWHPPILWFPRFFFSSLSFSPLLFFFSLPFSFPFAPASPSFPDVLLCVVAEELRRTCTYHAAASAMAVALPSTTGAADGGGMVASLASGLSIKRRLLSKTTTCVGPISLPMYYFESCLHVQITWVYAELTRRRRYAAFLLVVSRRFVQATLLLLGSCASQSARQLVVSEGVVLGRALPVAFLSTVVLPCHPDYLANGLV